MFRVTVLKNGVDTGDVEEFPDRDLTLRALDASASPDYVDMVREWIDNGHHENLLITESSVWSEIWEYVP